MTSAQFNYFLDYLNVNYRSPPNLMKSFGVWFPLCLPIMKYLETQLCLEFGVHRFTGVEVGVANICNKHDLRALLILIDTKS